MLTRLALEPLIVAPLLSLLFCISFSRDTITPTQPLKDGDVLISPGEIFSLGFFSPANSGNRYVGIWYVGISPQTVVWVANRDNPIRNNSGVFSIDGEGNLVLYGDQNQKSPVWSANSTPSTSKTRAQLLDSGNLVLLGDNGEESLWQSFDHPTNTLLPQMKIGFNRRNGLNLFLTSWKKLEDDPGTGDFSLRLNPDGYPQLLFYNNSGGRRKIRWRPGSWNGFRWTGAPKTNMYNSSFTFNEDEVTVKWDNNQDSTFARLTVEDWGSVVEYRWDRHQGRWIENFDSPKVINI